VRKISLQELYFMKIYSIHSIGSKHVHYLVPRGMQLASLVLLLTKIASITSELLLAEKQREKYMEKIILNINSTDVLLQNFQNLCVLHIVIIKNRLI